MALPKVNVLPNIVVIILNQIGLLPETFIGVLNTYAEKYDAPAEYVEAVKTWLSQAVDVTAHAMETHLLLAYAEWTSGNPGVDPQAGSSA